MQTATTRTTKKPAPPTFAQWSAMLRADIERKAAACGCDVSGLTIEIMTTDNTWGDRTGLVFSGASDEVCERAARFFEAWAGKHLRRMGVVGGYNAQESIGYVGKAYFSRYANGAKGWYIDGSGGNTVDPVAMTVTTYYGRVSHPVEVRTGFATSFIYYPCAD